MMNDKLRSEFEQSQAMLAETIPPLIKAMHDGFVREGFSEDQAFRLSCEFLKAQFGSGSQQ